MKRILFVLVLALLPVLVLAQDSTKTLSFEGSYVTTMTATKDTIDIDWGSNRHQFNYYMVYAKSSATDTIRVWTLGEDGFIWSPCGVTGIGTGTTALFINATATPAKYILTDPLPRKIRVIYESDDEATCVISVTGVYATQ